MAYDDKSTSPDESPKPSGVGVQYVEAGDGDAGQRLDARALGANAPDHALFYVCGPARLIDAVREAAAAQGLPPERVRFERFQATAQPDDRPVTVVLRRSRRTIEVAAGQRILDAVHAAGVAAPSACRTGTCGTCATKVLEGIPEHRDSALSAAERERAGMMCICVSRACTPALTLDL